MPISPVAARQLDAHERRQRADEIFRSGQYEGEELRMGQVLRRVRESLGLDLAEIARISRIRENFLMAIERMELQTIAKGYLVPYLIAYSKYLGLPEQDVVQRYTRECGAVDEVKTSAPVPKIGQIKKNSSNVPLIAAIGGALVVFLAGVVTAVVLMNKGPEEVVSPTVVAVSGARDSLFADTDAATAVPTDLPLEIVAVRQGWLEIRGSDGTIFLSRTMAEGENYFPRLKAGWTVSARNGGAFEWRVGDLSVGPLGPEGAQVFSVSVDDQLVHAAEVVAQAAAEVPPVAANGNAAQ
ncbi:helix-turn-helix domain-containing protein [Hyphomonas sp.]|uniref:helix-turn-helix domain-containing protein n=1 Tax=Hyphomonas sp. TaxID=87 RepID=UPI0025C68A93|nr:helix-turn-helix domain-containing protein [Hyphomonas sp.]